MSLKIRQQFNRVFGETREYDLHSLVFLIQESVYKQRALLS